MRLYSKDGAVGDYLLLTYEPKLLLQGIRIAAHILCCRILHVIFKKLSLVKFVVYGNNVFHGLAVFDLLKRQSIDQDVLIGYDCQASSQQR